MTDDARRIPGLTLTCLTGRQCTVHFEPWGTEHVLISGDVVHVETTALSTGDVEVSYVEGGIALTFAVDVPIVVTDRMGQHLEI